jgi:hypothetical protein
MDRDSHLGLFLTELHSGEKVHAGRCDLRAYLSLIAIHCIGGNVPGRIDTAAALNIERGTGYRLHIPVVQR